MCYDIKASLQAQLKRARRKGDKKAMEEIIEKIIPHTDLPIHHTSGFSHPDLLIYTNEKPFYPTIATWGLIPHWIKNIDQRNKYWNNTLNARGETIFEKPSFRDAAKNHRCIIYIDGFYEHHHFNKNTYPFFIYRKDGEAIGLAGLWSEWQNPESGEVIKSFTIVTTVGNSKLDKIHNNPKLKEPRMPLILPEELEDEWLVPIKDNIDKQKIEELIQSYPSEELTAHTVAKLRGKNYKGNVEGISEELTYPELDLQLNSYMKGR